MSSYLKKNNKKIYLIIFCFLVFFLPFTHYLELGPFNFGGDSTRLYIHYPDYWIKNYSINLINYGNPYIPTAGNAAMTPQLLFYYLLNLISPNLSIYLHNSFIALTAFLGIFFLLKDTVFEYLKKKNFFLIILLSLLYLTSQLYSHFIFNNGGFWVYVFAGAPFLCTFFSRFLIYGTLKNLIFFYLFLIFYSSIFLYQNISWSIMVIINCLALYCPLFLKIAKTKIIKRFSVIFLIFIIFNLGNFISFFNEFLNRTSLANEQFTFNFLTEADYVGNNFFPLYNLQNLDLQIKGSDVYGTENIYFLKFFLLINSVLIVLSVIYFVTLKNNIKNFIIYNKFRYVLIFFLINFFLINQSFNNLIINVFNLLYKVEYFTIFKSYYGKFTFSYLISFISLIYIFSIFLYKKNYTRNIIYYLFFFIIFLSSVNFINGKVYNLKNRFSQSYPINGLSNDFYALIHFLNKANSYNFSGNIILLPVSSEYYLDIIPLEKRSYVAPSPISLFENIRVFYGYENNKVIYDALLLNNQKEFFKNLDNKFINYIIYNKNNFKSLENYLYPYNTLQKKNLNNIEFFNPSFLNVFENDTFLVLKYEKNFLKCSTFKLIRPTLFSLKTDCENHEHFIEDIKKFSQIVGISIDDLVFHKSNSTVSFSELNFINPLIVFKNSELLNIKKGVNNNDFIVIYRHQIYQDFCIILSILFPLFIILIYYLRKQNEIY
jgi:hypothetical protein